jgi:serine/threonine protein kinase
MTSWRTVGDPTETEVDETADAPGHTEATKREGPGTVRPSEPRVERGTAVGRYIVLDVLGTGGMGVVYTAYDPELDRKVAVKLLQADRGLGSGGQAWLLREAQALARLSHPNVVAVYDVGTLPGDRVFIAMELVEGVTLRAWLRAPDARRRPWRQVLSVLLDAGAGLAAAHAAGLVHRDFKPENVLVGNDGRVRVMDFGLARLQPELAGEVEQPVPPERSSDPLIESRSPLSAHLTTKGSVVGTPAYMAPELYAGTGADTRSDQFSFGVALYEGLFRTRPFKRDGAKQKVKAAKPPAETRVPARMQRVVMRAVSIEPAERFATMDELLAALARDAVPRRRVLIATGAAAVLGLVVVTGFMMSSSPPNELCTGVDRRLTGVWDAGTRQLVRGAFDATKRPSAAKTFARVEHQLDTFAAEWTTTATDSCSATQIRAEQSEEVWSLRQACLDERLDELRALTSLLEHADGDLVDQADKLAGGLESVAGCSNVTALRAPGQPPSQPKAVVDELRTKFADAKVQVLAGRYQPALPEIDRVAVLAEELHYAPYKADVLRIRATALAGVGRSEEAAAACAEAAAIATTARADGVLIGSALCAAVTTPRDKVGEARIWLQLARSMLARPGNQDAQIELRLREAEAFVAAQAGDTAAMIVAQQKALDAATKLLGADNPLLWWDENTVAVALAQSGAYDKARPHFERAVALREQNGDDGPDFPSVLSNLATCYARTGDPDKAKATYARAVAMEERGDPNPISLALTLNNMSDGLIKSGDATGALVYLDRAATLVDKQVGRGNPLYHAIATTRAEALTALGKLADARAEYDEVIAAEAKTDSPYLGPTLSSRAQLELGAMQWREVAAFENRAIAVIEGAHGKDSPELWPALAGLGRATVELGRPAEARVVLERAIALGEKAEVGASELEPVRALLKRLP